MLLVRTFLIILVAYEIDGHHHKKAHVSHSHANKVGRRLRKIGRGDKRTIDDDKHEGSTQICGISQKEQEALANIQRAKEVKLCENSIINKGCYKDVAKKLGGNMLIDESDQAPVPFLYYQHMYDLLCRCSTTALKNGNKLFGITDNAQCWGFNGTASDLVSLEKSSHCIVPFFAKPACKEHHRFCAATSQNQTVSNFIYLAIEKEMLRRKWELMGYTSQKTLFPEEADSTQAVSAQNRDEIKKEYIIHGNDTYHVAPWESKVIPFDFDASVDNIMASQVLRGMYHMEKYTCVKFRRKMFDEDLKSGYVHFKATTWVCYSPPGRRVNKPNEVLLTHNCLRGAVAHMMLQTIGFLPPTMREDRDEYVDINFDNIKQRGINFKKGKGAFGKDYRGTSFGVPYDFNSILHFREYIRHISVDPHKKIVKLKEKWRKKCESNKFGCVLGQLKGLSKSDTIQVNKLFKCKIKPQTSWECPTYTSLDDFRNKYFQEFRKDLCLRLSLKQ
eukprot:Seg1614.5 transcript_id=Seg1614.5/GoldUCD/mRNA.D3Y31 product="Tolloid-like protein 1" protein_id=Seg1614.5/GoldUCD/D3Y31